MANPVMRGFRNVGRFSGRDTPKQFWPYLITVFAVVMVLMFAGAATTFGSIISDMQSFAAEHPEATTVTQGPGSYSISIDATHPDAPMPDMISFLAVIGMCALIGVGLLAAAVSRRLHDTGRSAYFGLLPLPFLAFGLVAFPMVMKSFMAEGDAGLGLFFMLFFNNMLYIGSLILLLVLLTRRTQDGPNRYGDQPLA